MSILRKSLAVSVLILAISLATTTTLADGGGHLWFYSKDPPLPLPDPITWDENYVGYDPDPWVSESIVIPPKDDWDTPFSIWLACAQFESLDTMLVVSINIAASEGIETITITTPEDTFTIPLDSPWYPHPPSDSEWAPGGIPGPHGVFNSDEFQAYAEVPVGDLYSPNKWDPEVFPYMAEIVVDIDLKDGVSSGMKIHLDAYGYTEDQKYIFSPFSHDLTVVPELGTVLLAAASFSALALYALKRRKYFP